MEYKGYIITATLHTTSDHSLTEDGELDELIQTNYHDDDPIYFAEHPQDGLLVDDMGYDFSSIEEIKKAIDDLESENN